MNKTISRKARVYYIDEQYVYYIDNDDETNTLKSHNIKDKRKYMSEGYNYFEAQQEFLTTHEELIRYKQEFNKYLDDAENEFKNKRIKFEYRTKYSHNDAVFRLYKYLQTRELKPLNMDKIEDYEFMPIEMCNNGALIEMNEEYKNQMVESYGSDYSAYYPNLLNSGLLYMPYKKGHLTTIETLDLKNLKFGIYKCMINKKETTKQQYEFNKPNKQTFKKAELFKFNKDYYYTHLDIEFCSKYPDKFEILLCKEENNLLYWNDDELVNTKTITSNWFNILSELKIKLKGNFVVKRMMSSLWGSFTKFNRVFFDEEEINNLSISRISSKEKTDYKIISIKHYANDSELGYKDVYECVKSSNAYSNEFARIKPFLISLSRLNIADVILSNNLENNLIRIHTDSIVLNKPFDYSKIYAYYPISEDKTTGLIKWYNSNNYKHICPKCKNEYKFDKLKPHKC